MRREAKLLLSKALDSLTLAIEVFNRPHECGRTTTVLILLDHSFEMLLKAAIVQRKGNIWMTDRPQTIGFSQCVGQGLSNGEIKFLSDDQALLLQMNNGLRDAAQHHLVDISEQQLYFQSQAGVTLFRDLLRSIFEIDLYTKLPSRVLPISSMPLTSLSALFSEQVEEIERLLRPGSRRRIEALSKLRALVITEEALAGNVGQPSVRELTRRSKAIRAGDDWEGIFPGVAALETTASGVGPSIDLRLSRKEGVQVEIVPEGTPGAGKIVLKRVDDLGFYNLGFMQLATKMKLSTAKTTAVIWYLKLKEDRECCKEFVIGKSRFPRYSQNAIAAIRDLLTATDIEQIWQSYRTREA